MIRQGIIGTIEEFELYDPKGLPRRTNRLPAGFMFMRAAEYLPELGGWVAQCHACHNLRCLEIDPGKETWQCSKCNRAGTFNKIEAMNRKIKIRKTGRKRKKRNE